MAIQLYVSANVGQNYAEIIAVEITPVHIKDRIFYVYTCDEYPDFAVVKDETGANIDDLLFEHTNDRTFWLVRRKETQVEEAPAPPPEWAKDHVS